MVGVWIVKLWLFGGNSNNGSNCGLAYANSNNAWSNSNSNISARITLLSELRFRTLFRMSVPRHGNASGYPEPRRQVRMYSLCLVGTIFTLRGTHQCARR